MFFFEDELDIFYRNYKQLPTNWPLSFLLKYWRNQGYMFRFKQVIHTFIYTVNITLTSIKELKMCG